MVILVVVTLATFSVLMTSLSAVRGNSDRVQAASLARTELERLRGLGAAGITLGRTQPTGYESTGFTVTTTANWVGVDQDTNPCESAVGGSPGRAFVRARIEVIGRELEAPQVIDAVVPPLDDIPAALTGSVTAWVRDGQISPQPAPGVTVTATSTEVGATTQSLVTGYDGCVFFADLVPGDWTVRIGVTPPDMIQPQTSSALNVANLDVGQNVPLSFFAGGSTAIEFAAGSSNFPLLAGMPFRGDLGTWAGSVPTTMPAGGFTIPDAGDPLLWPAVTGYTARLGCNDVGSPVVIAVQPGTTVTANLPATAIEFVGPAAAAVTVTHAAESGSPCSAGLSAAAGVLTVPLDPEAPGALPGPLGRAQVSVPLGTWTFTVVGEAPVTVTLQSSTPSPCSISWSVPTPTPSPTPSPASSSPAPSPSPSATASTLPTIEAEHPPCA